MLEIAKNYWKKLTSAAYDIGVYFKLASQGNIVERLTDFEKPELKPVLLIHGFGTTRKSVSILEQRLRDDGFDVFSLNLGGFLGKFNTCGIGELAIKVKNKIDSLSQRYNLGKIAIIGHSKGGLIGRYYVSLLGGNEHVHTLITLGTPHRGNRLAIMAAITVVGLISKSVWQMMPHSRFMRKMKESPIPENVYTVSIFSTGDSVVPAYRSKLDIPEGATHIKNIELTGCTHTDYLIKRGVYEVIRQELATSFIVNHPLPL